MDETTAAYLAGFFDGEGNIRIDRTNGRVNGKSYPRYSLRINLKQLDPRPLNLIATHFGGTVRMIPRKGRNPKWRDIHEWNANASRACALLKVMQPYMIVKAEQAKLAIEFQAMLDAREGRKSAPLSEEERQARIAYADTIGALSHRVYEGFELVVGSGTDLHFAYRARIKLPKIKRQGKHPVKPKGQFVRGPRPKRPDIEVFRRDYEDLGVVQAALKYGISTGTVYNWLDKFGIPRSGVTEKTKERFRAAQQKSYSEYKKQQWGDLADQAVFNPRSHRYELPLPEKES